jgi:hypothetical protein
MASAKREKRNGSRRRSSCALLQHRENICVAALLGENVRLVAAVRHLAMASGGGIGGHLQRRQQ